MSSTERNERAKIATTDPQAGTSPAEPASLGELITWVMDRRGYTNLMQLSKQTRVPYQTLWAWKQGSRNMRRRPAVPILQQLAQDLNLSDAMVFHAAGRAFSQPGDLSEGELQVLHLYQELSPEDREFAETMLRNLAERA